LPYTISTLSERLIYIRWEGSPSAEEGLEFINSLNQVLNEAPTPLYFISDLRFGCITRSATLYKLTRLAAHPNWGGSVSFSGSAGIAVFVNLFARLSRRLTKEMWSTPHEAIAHLETLQPGLTTGIDWKTVLGNVSQSELQRL
jgi:hypothetical protein